MILLTHSLYTFITTLFYSLSSSLSVIYRSQYSLILTPSSKGVSSSVLEHSQRTRYAPTAAPNLRVRSLCTHSHLRSSFFTHSLTYSHLFNTDAQSLTLTHFSLTLTYLSLTLHLFFTRTSCHLVSETSNTENFTPHESLLLAFCS